MRRGERGPGRMMCDPCQAEWASWLDYRQPIAVTFAAGAAYDTTLAGVRDRQRARFDDWRNTVLAQQALIEQHCAANHQEGRQ